MKKIYFSLFALFSFGAGFGQTVEVSANPGTTGNLPFGTSNYAASESIYTQTEIGAANFTSAGTSLDKIAFNTSTLGAATTFNNVKIYFKDVPLTTTAFSTGTYTTTGYTLVFDGSVTLAATGWTELALTTPYVRATGTNLQMLIERTDNASHTGFVYVTANGNNTSASVNSTRRYNAATVLSGTTSLGASAFRPAIRFIRKYNDDANVKRVYTLGKLPLPNGTPHIISANVSNDGINTLTNLNVTLNITGSNTFTNTQIIPSLASGASTTVSFTGFTPTVEGTNTVTVSVPSDDFNDNNSSSVTQLANKNTWSYAYGATAAGGVGFNGATGDFVAKFNTNAATAISQVSVNFTSSGQPYQIGIWDASGAGGTPGTNLFTSATLTSVTGVNVIPINPAPSIAVGNFYVGVRQTGTSNVNFAYQTETPIRGNTFYFASPSGGTTWTDFAPANSFRFMIEPKLILPIDASVNTFVLPSSTTCQPTPQTYSATLTNTGANTINIGAANVTLKVAGANVYLGSTTNTTSLASGASEVINFPNVNVSNPGQNFDTLFVALTGDLDNSNDTLKATNTTLNTVINLPLVERYEAATLNIGQVLVLTGGTPRSITSLRTGSYTNVDLGGTLQPHGDSKMILFDNYSGTTTLGIRNRLYSNCITVPSVGANQCSNYQLSFWLSHDNSYTTDLDSVYLNVTTDGGVTWNRILPGYGRVDAAFAIPGWKKETVSMNAYAGQTIQIGFEAVSKYGNIIALDDIQFGSVGAGSVILSSAANNAINLTPDCTDFGWTYYIDPADATKPLMAINWDPANSGANTAAKAAATASMQIDAANFAAENITALTATYTMKRYWNVNLNAAVMTAPVNVRFFYDKADTASANAAAQAFATANSVAVKTPSWFKTTTGSFVGDAAHVKPSGVVDPTALTNVNTTGETINGVLYAQFNGINNFSGGTYATGAGLGSVLPVFIEFFKGSKQGTSNFLDWKLTCTNEPSITMSLERSADGRSFKSIQDQTATATRCLQSFNYVDATPLAGYNYYRLKTVTLDGKVKYSTIVVLLNKEKGFELISIVPNPVQNTAILSLTTVKGGKIELSVSDLAGKVISKQSKIVIAGNNPINMNFASLSAGTYIITAVNADGEIKTTRFVKL
jgi:hypothetical protein